MNSKGDEHPQPAPPGEAPDPQEVGGQISSVVHRLRQIAAAAFDADVAVDLVEERAAYRAS